MTLASVVFPHPGGPYINVWGRVFASISLRNTASLFKRYLSLVFLFSVGVKDNLDFPYAKTVIKIQSKSRTKKFKRKPQCRYYVSSADIDTYSPQQWLNLIRGHWGGIENRNHWRKDACLFEDKPRSRNPNIVTFPAMMRNIVIFFFRLQEQHQTINGFVEDIAADSNKALSLVCSCFWFQIKRPWRRPWCRQNMVALR